MQTKFTPAPSQRRKPREEYLNHPKFMEMFGEAMVGIETPKDKIPQWMDIAIYEALDDMSFPSLGIPLIIYEELITVKPENMTFGVLQKAADIVFSCKPGNNSIETHLKHVKAMAALLDAMKEITDPIRDKVIDQLIASDKIIK